MSTTTAPPALELQRRVKEFIVANFYVTDPELLHADAPLVENGVVDSTGILEVISFLEAAFDIRVADDEILPENLGSISRISAFVTRKLAP